MDRNNLSWIIERLNLVELPISQLLTYYITKIIAELLSNSQQVVSFHSFFFLVVIFLFSNKDKLLLKDLLIEKEQEITKRKDPCHLI